MHFQLCFAIQIKKYLKDNKIDTEDVHQNQTVVTVIATSSKDN